MLINSTSKIRGALGGIWQVQCNVRVIACVRQVRTGKHIQLEASQKLRSQALVGFGDDASHQHTCPTNPSPNLYPRQCGWHNVIWIGLDWIGLEQTLDHHATSQREREGLVAWNAGIELRTISESSLHITCNCQSSFVTSARERESPSLSSSLSTLTV
jgi:hypothetical protein